MHADSLAQAPRPSGQRRDVRRRALTITLLATLAIGAGIALYPDTPDPDAWPNLRFADLVEVEKSPRPLSDADLATLRTRFQQGVMMLHMRQYEYALTAFHQVLAMAPQMPEAHANMGFALLGLEQWQQARDFFDSATNLRREQHNAYYGMAIALEELGDLPGAMGAMQTYLHRAPPDDSFRERAEAALWEWREAARNAAASGTDETREPTPKD